MSSPQRRPRDKGGGTELGSLAAKGFELSNSTMTKFLGGKQKPWMIQHNVVDDRNLTTTSSYARSAQPKPNTSTGGEKSPVNTPSENDRDQFQASLQSNVNQDPGSQTDKGTVPPSDPGNTHFTIPNQMQQGINAILSSSAPGDGPPQGNSHIIDLEEEEYQPNHLSSQQKSPSNELAQNQLTSQVQSQKSIEEHKTLVQDTELRQDVSELANTNSLSPMQVESSRPAAIKRGLEPQSDSRKRAQMTSQSRSESPRFESHQSREGLPLGQTPRVAPDADIRSFLSQIADRFNAMNRRQYKRGWRIEIGRLELLQDACSRQDFFYLMIHELLCLKSSSNLSSSSPFHGLAPEHLNGLNLLDTLLAPNNQMESEAILWFSTFPLSLEVLLEKFPATKSLYKKTLECLIKLPQVWVRIRDTCHTRSYPPLADEMSNLFGVANSVLQKVISMAILRDIWPGLRDECYNEGERLFLQNQQAVQIREAQQGGGQTLSAATIRTYNKRIANEYKRIWSQHQQHIQSNNVQQRQSTTFGANTSRAPPQQILNNVPPAASVSISRNISQPSQVRANSPAALLTHINTRSNPQSPVSFPPSTPTIPSSALSNMQISSVLAAEDPITQQYYQPYVRLSAPPQQRRSRGRPRRDGAPTMTSGNTDLGLLAPSKISAHNSQQQGNLQPQVVTANTLPQPISGPWINQSNSGIGHPNVTHPTRSSTAMPVSPLHHYHNNFRTRFDHQGVLQQRSATVPLHWQGQVSPSVPYNSQSLSGLYNLQHETYRAPLQHTTSWQDQSSTSHLFLPPPGHTRLLTESSNPISNALHQVQARSPTFTSINKSNGPSSKDQLFAFVRHLIVMPSRLNSQRRHFKWDFKISKEDYDKLAKDVDEKNGVPPIRRVQNGSCYLRLRCTKVTDMGEIPDSDWVVADTTWPSGVAVLINGIALEIRKKIHHGRDLPVDVTKIVQNGDNELSVATIRPKPDDQADYAIALETIQFADSATIEKGISKLDVTESLKRIMKHSHSADPEVQVVGSAIILDLTDPCTLRIFNKPVRGHACRHNQCFDLEVFLQSRSRKSPIQPSLPDHFKCPICGLDARPQSLIIDLFFLSVRKELEQRNRLDVKNIVLDENGSWDIREEGKAGEPGDDSAKPQPKVDEPAHGSAQKGFDRRESEIIALDD